MLTSMDVKFIFDSACLSARLEDKRFVRRVVLLLPALAVLAMFLANGLLFKPPLSAIGGFKRL